MRLALLDRDDTGTLEVVDGERVVLLGCSGSGKTQIIKQLLGLDRPLIDRRGSLLAESCAYVPQTDGVFLDLSVLENLTAPGPHVARVAEAEARDWLDLVGLAQMAELPASALSFANRRRVSLARALSRRRPLLVIDGVLDPTVSTFLPDLLTTVPHLCSVLTTSCVADQWAWTADRVALVNDTRVLAQDSLTALAASTDPSVQDALTWVVP